MKSTFGLVAVVAVLAVIGMFAGQVLAADEGAAKKVLGIPAKVRLVQLMPMGYPADKARPRTRLMACSASRSAWVTGVWSGLMVTSKPPT